MKPELRYSRGTRYNMIIEDYKYEVGKVIDKAREEMTDQQFRHFKEDLVEELD